MNTRSMTSKIIALVIAVGIAAPNAAWADPARAAEYYQQATDAYQAGDLQKAADLLERAFAEEPDLVYQYNRILALEALKEYSQARKVMEIYEEQMLRDEEKRFVDTLEIKARLEKGEADLVAKEAEEAEKKRLEEEEKQRLLAEKEKDKEKPKEQPVNWGAISLIGAGGTSLIVGTLFGSGMFISEFEDAKCISEELRENGGDYDFAWVDCGENAALEDTDDYQAVLDSQSNHQIIAISLWSVGALAVGGGIIWLLTGDSDESSVSVAPMITPNGGGATAGFRF